MCLTAEDAPSNSTLEAPDCIMRRLLTVSTGYAKTAAEMSTHKANPNFRNTEVFCPPSLKKTCLPAS